MIICILRLIQIIHNLNWKPKIEMQMNDKFIKRYSDQLNIKLVEMETMRYHFSTVKLAKKE